MRLLKLVYWAIITLFVSRICGISYILFTRIYQCQEKPYGNCWTMLHGNVLRHPRGYLWLGIAASGLHSRTDLYISSSYIDYCKCTHYLLYTLFIVNPCRAHTGAILFNTFCGSHVPEDYTM